MKKLIQITISLNSIIISYYFIYTLLLLFTIFIYPLKLYSVSLVCAQNPIPIYYVRFDIKSVDNRMERSNLLIVPADNEFRQEKFISFVISGSADYLANGQKGVYIQTRAAHNAIKNFLEKKGLESVKSQSTTVKGLAHDKTAIYGQTMVNDQTVVSFEGAIKLPYKILNSKFNSETGIYSITIEIEFAPLSFPDKWEKMLFKQEVKMLLNQFRSFF